MRRSISATTYLLLLILWMILISGGSSHAQTAQTRQQSEELKLEQDFTNSLTTLPQLLVRDSYTPANYGECLDWIIPLTEQHLWKTLMLWLTHYNRGRPHSSLGPGLPDPPLNSRVRMQRHRHRFDRPSQIVARAVLNGLHHEYSSLAHAA